MHIYHCYRAGSLPYVYTYIHLIKMCIYIYEHAHTCNVYVYVCMHAWILMDVGVVCLYVHACPCIYTQTRSYMFV